MFDIGFWEMAFIGVIALVIIGPERLPGAARNVGLWVGKGRRMLAEIQADVKKEIDAQDLAQVKELKNELTSATKELGDIASVDSDPLGIKEAGEGFKKSMDEIGAAAKGESTKPAVKKPAVKKKPSSAKKKTKKKTTKKKTARKKPPAKKAPSSAKKTTKRKSVRKKSSSRPSATKTVRKVRPKKTAGRNPPQSVSTQVPARQSTSTKKTARKPGARDKA